MLKWLCSLFVSTATSGQAGYRRGFKNGTEFAATNPSDEEFRRHLVSSDPPWDDYDTGYLRALMAAKPDFEV